ncbi:MAG: S-ribosylhomocysteine lyase [Bacillota bacterium]|nr:S-ribosylhomocysteine lyase [Bacillota bacterium]
MPEVERITSFSVDHDFIRPGMYISRIDGDITTYDLRTRRPNQGDYMDNVTMHSLEHMVATYLRNSDIKGNIIYFGPMGCATGFYLLVKEEKPEEVLKALKEALRKTIAHEGEVFGSQRKECGNYQCLSIDSAKIECERYLKVLEAKEKWSFEYDRF